MYLTMILLLIFVLFSATLGRAIDEAQQIPLLHASADNYPGDVPGGIPGTSIITLCEESQDTDILSIYRLVNMPQVPYLDDVTEVLIWGNFSHDVSMASTVDYQVNITANTGDSGALNGTLHICDSLEKMHQPPDSNEPERACPPKKGPVFMQYSWWFADWLVAPGIYSVRFDAKTPEGERIYCLRTKFDLQCPPEHDGPECLRNLPGKEITK